MKNKPFLSKTRCIHASKKPPSTSGILRRMSKNVKKNGGCLPRKMKKTARNQEWKAMTGRLRPFPVINPRGAIGRGVALPSRCGPSVTAWHFCPVFKTHLFIAVFSSQPHQHGHERVPVSFFCYGYSCLLVRLLTSHGLRLSVLPSLFLFLSFSFSFSLSLFLSLSFSFFFFLFLFLSFIISFFFLLLSSSFFIIHAFSFSFVFLFLHFCRGHATYKPPCRSVRRSVCRSVCRSVGRSVTLCFFCIFGHFKG